MLDPKAQQASGHGGGGAGVMHDFLQALQSDEQHVLTSAADSLASHLVAFAAEDARVRQCVIEMSVYFDQVGA